MKRDLANLARNTYDVLVVGGGIYGMFVAWDAALRGLSVALVEKGDFGQGTSSNTLRTIHGGLRYLQHGDIRRLRRSIQERTAFMRIAPHLVHPLPFLIPTYGQLLRGKAIFTLALLINRLAGLSRSRLEDPQKHLPPGRITSREECLQIFPGLDERGLTGGVIYYDAQMHNSERLLLSIANSAANLGADLANYLEVIGFMQEGSRVRGAQVRNVLTKEEFHIRASVVVNTGGPWLDRLLCLLNGRPPKERLALSKAFNLVIGRQLVRDHAVGIYYKARFNDRDAILSKGSRLFFITPWQGRSLIGTVHLPYDSDPDSIRLTEEEIDSFLKQINEACSGVTLNRQDVCFTYRGLLPKLASGRNDTQLVKHYRLYDHGEEDGVEGLISVVGVKFTEARHVAEKTVDLVFTKMNKKPPKSVSAFTRLYGGDINHFNDFVASAMRRAPKGLSPAAVGRLVHRYGSAYSDVLAYLGQTSNVPQTMNAIAHDQTCPSRELHPVVTAEICHGIRAEMAQKLGDIVFRRTDLGSAGIPWPEIVTACASVMAKELSWGESRIQREIQEIKQSTELGTRPGLVYGEEPDCLGLANGRSYES